MDVTASTTYSFSLGRGYTSVEHELTEADDEIATLESLQYDFNTIRAVTNHFSDENKHGQGRFGVVYKV
ncbi:hypothetical protein PVK06_030904 [Gossypium arboreum]|uniref:Uncharacterized protein n=1 Tax=Gossypium arboreum TaxID=29729 RepID=A0ABR0NPI7_GOSAR|nr:hypothetical protein PVK06_030904 [Gossypium arboreum]